MPAVLHSREQPLMNQAIKIESNVSAEMRDGTTLYADVYRPEGEGRFPVLLQRTPYDKSSPTSYGVALDALRGGARRLRRGDPGRTRTLRLRGRVLHLRQRVDRRL